MFDISSRPGTSSEDSKSRETSHSTCHLASPQRQISTHPLPSHNMKTDKSASNYGAKLCCCFRLLVCISFSVYFILIWHTGSYFVLALLFYYLFINVMQCRGSPVVLVLKKTVINRVEEESKKDGRRSSQRELCEDVGLRICISFSLYFILIWHAGSYFVIPTLFY